MKPATVLPEQLRAWRKAKGLSQRQAAEKLDIRPGTWRNWEQGIRTPRGFAFVALQKIIKKGVAHHNISGVGSGHANEN